MNTQIGVMILDGDFDFFHIVDDMDWQRAETIFHDTFFVDGNHTGQTPCAAMVAVLKVWSDDNV
jgi:hypothetical protein